jgi:hypothetical protein
MKTLFDLFDDDEEAWPYVLAYETYNIESINLLEYCIEPVWYMSTKWISASIPLKNKRKAEVKRILSNNSNYRGFYEVSFNGCISFQSSNLSRVFSHIQALGGL